VSVPLSSIHYAIPSLIVLAILAFFGAIVWLIALVLMVVNERYPDSLWRFLRGIVRWEACLFAYLASLVEALPAVHARDRLRLVCRTLERLNARIASRRPTRCYDSMGRCDRPRFQNGRRRMEPLWSPVVATSGNRWQIGSQRERHEQAKTVVVGCHRLPETFHGKQGVCCGLRPVASRRLPRARRRIPALGLTLRLLEPLLPQLLNGEFAI
jgi:hypothetical protein